jgi:hypothetical protein
MGKIHAVLNINKHINRANWFHLQAFRIAIAFQTASRIPRIIINASIHHAITGAAEFAYRVGSGVIIFW